MHNETYTTEYDVESKFIEIIQRNWYHFNPISTYEELLQNFRNRLNDLNKDKLNGQLITDEEFKNICIYLENKSIFEASQILRTGKIDIIKRNGFPIYLKLVNLDDVEKNYFEVAHQIKSNGTYAGRFDVTLLINGIPFIQIELKKPGVELNEAFNQVLRYKRDGNYKGLFNLIQLFVISNEQHTKYFANNDTDIKKSNCFVWTDEENERINLLYDFEESFLFCPQLFHMVFDYMIDSKSQKRLFVMRPYQIYAFKALTKRCLKDNENGYCFHSTGSGKTLTSFKFAFAMSKEPEISKVFFLVDRRDLDDKTVDDFNSYMSSSVDEFTNVKKTDSLIKDIKSNKKLIVSTINKMANALKGRHLDELKDYKDKKIIFMFDECHRSQAGEMRKIIERYFTNALYYGFTGTPIFNEDDAISENAMLTSLYFGKPVHTYTMKEAIGDHNILPLCIDYVNSIKLKDGTLTELDKQVQGIDYEGALLDDKRIKVVTNDVLNHFEAKTSNKRYNAIFACESIQLLIKYYKAFLNNKLGLKIAAIYSYDPNEDCKEGDNPTIAKDELAKIIDEYNKRPENNSNFSISNYAQYERDVINNFRNKTIDILFVVDKCLTGMDFVKCNTLYLDKSMRMHGLIQAISRTVRTYDESKICGNIVCYQTSRKTMDDALAHFNNDVDVYNDVTLLPLNVLIKELNAYYADCESKRALADSPSETDKLEFVKSFRNLMHTYNQAVNYIDFDVNDTDVKMKQYYQLQGLYKDIYNSLKPNAKKDSILNDIDFEINLLGSTKVDFDYLVELLRRFQKGDEDDRKKTRNKIKRLVMAISEKSKKNLILKFVNSFMDQDIAGLYDKDPVKEYEKFINKEKDEELNKMTSEFNVNKDSLKKVVDDYAFYQDDVELNKEVTNLYSGNENLDFSDRIKYLNALPASIKGYFDKFNSVTLY